MAQIRALVAGEEPPPEHPRARDPRFESSVIGLHGIKGGGEGPVPDLSEPEQPGRPDRP